MCSPGLHSNAAILEMTCWRSLAQLRKAKLPQGLNQEDIAPSTFTEDRGQTYARFYWKERDFKCVWMCVCGRERQSECVRQREREIERSEMCRP